MLNHSGNDIHALLPDKRFITMLYTAIPYDVLLYYTCSNVQPFFYFIKKKCVVNTQLHVELIEETLRCTSKNSVLDMKIPKTANLCHSKNPG